MKQKKSQGITYQPKNHSLRLGDWASYSKRYIGISHIPDESSGVRFDLSVFPGLYRRRVDVPSVMWESAYHPWDASADLNYFVFRHQVEWKDRVFCDVSYSRVDGQTRLIRAHCINQTDDSQSLALHYAASLNFPSPGPYYSETIQSWRICLPAGAIWIDAMDYFAMNFAHPRPNDQLGWDGLFRGEQSGHGFVGQSGLGNGFGRDAGDRVEYRFHLDPQIPGAAVLLRYRLAGDKPLTFQLSGLSTAQWVLSPSAQFTTATLPLGTLQASEQKLLLTSAGGAAVEIAGLVIAPADQLLQVTFPPTAYDPVPQLIPGPTPNTLILKYRDAEPYYGLAWNSDSFFVREIRNSELDSLLRHRAHDHVNRVLQGDDKGHYTNIFIRPVSLAPRSSTTVDGLVCQGTLEEVRANLSRFHELVASAATLEENARSHAVDLSTNAAGQPYAFSQRCMAATILTNLVYPVYTQRQYIKHYSPGKWWDCLYTWDSGFNGLGLAEYDIQQAIDSLNAYLTDPGNPHAAFIHHGSPVPVQFFLFLELWNRTQSRELLQRFYPSLRQYYLFMAGRQGGSTTANLKSGLLRTWDYFYNSGGWDDYPPQVHVHAHKLAAGVAPIAPTCTVARSAAILLMAATALDFPEDVADYRQDIGRFRAALQQHAWDSQAGYFAYVNHDQAGQPIGFMRHQSGANFNMGLDGAYPLVAGLCTPAQRERLVNYLKDPQRLWSAIGLTSVDQSAPYYRKDGYWNGTVWMPHQWFYWKTMLDLGEADFAWKIARTGLDLWKREVELSYHCFEHFIIETGRGVGWHQFGGISSPVVSWYNAYHRPGRLTCGFTVWVQQQKFNAARTEFAGRLRLFPEDTPPTVLVCLRDNARYRATWNGEAVPSQTLQPGLLSITLPAVPGEGLLEVKELAK